MRPTRIALFGNCQVEALERVLRLALPDRGFEIACLANNPFTGEMLPTEGILETLGRADVVVFQPLGKRFGVLSQSSLRESLSNTVLTFPRLFNAGIAGLCFAPLATRAPSNTYGGEMIVKLLEQGVTPAEIKRRYREGGIDFELPRRFDECVEIMRRRESSTDIVFADYIEANHRSKRLFLTHNHPATPLFVELSRQIATLSALPIDLVRIHSVRGNNIGGLPQGYAPISPFDADALGYEFPFDPNWYEAGSMVIDHIAQSHLGNQPARDTGAALIAAARAG